MRIPSLVALKASVLGAVLALLVITGLHSTDEPDQRTRTVSDAYSRVMQRAMSDGRCSTSGFAGLADPTSALVRTPQGEVRMVSFARGWKVYTGEAPGRLIAVCLGGRPGTAIQNTSAIP